MSNRAVGKTKVISFDKVVQKATTNNNTTTKQNPTKVWNLDCDDVEFLPNLTLPALNELDLPDEISSRLFNHQKDGVSWLYSCYLNSSGALLADDMGLGMLLFTLSSF